MDECIKLMRNQNIEHTDAKGIRSIYGTSNGIVLFIEDKTIKRNIKRHRYAYEMRSKKE